MKFIILFALLYCSIQINTISGTWKNDLDSIMNLMVKESDLTGFYQSKVGNVTDRYLLTGRIINYDDGSLLSFSVSWNNTFRNSFSVTSWSGQYFKDDNKIHTTWILTRRSSLKDKWNSQNIGSNTFIKIQ